MGYFPLDTKLPQRRQFTFYFILDVFLSTHKRHPENDRSCGYAIKILKALNASAELEYNKNLLAKQHYIGVKENAY